MPPIKSDIASNYLVWLFLCLLASAFVYSGSVTIPFYLDDIGSIVSNPILHSGQISALYDHYGLRIGGYLTFYINLLLGAKDPYWFHIANVAIHLTNGLLVFLFVRSISRFIQSRINIELFNIEFFAIFVAGLWLLHPLNSQPVVYIVQRLAELAATGFLLTGWAYFQFRNTEKWWRWLWLLLIASGVVIGVSSKQNYFTIFVVLFVIEYVFGNCKVKQRINKVFFVSVVIFAIFVPFIADLLNAIDIRTRENHSIPRSEYFYSQLIILFVYIRKFLLPVDIQLFMSVDIYKEVVIPVFIAMLAHVVFIIAAYRFRYTFPYLTLGTILFYASHLVESSIIPITDFAFEHRTYIPNVGLSLIVLEILIQCNKKIKLTAPKIVVVPVVLLIAFAVITYKRVEQWQDPLLFYKREVALSPISALANQGYGFELMKLKRYEEAEPYLANAYNYKLQQNQLSVSNLNLYMTVLFHLDKYAQANQVANKAMQYIRYAPYKSQILGNMSYGYIKMGMCDFALNIAKRAVDLDPNNQSAKMNYQHCLQELQNQHHNKGIGANK